MFCNQKAITGKSFGLPDARQTAETIRTFIACSRPRSQVEVAFFGGNFLGLAPGQITTLLENVRPFLTSGAVHGIRFSTRPDTVTRERLDQIGAYPISLVELGVQSMDDRVLAMVNRGHTREDTCRAINRLNEVGINAGVQIMAGLPGDAPEGVVQTARILADMNPLTARIYPVLVLENTRLARWYHDGKYHPLTLEQAVAVTSRAYRIFTRAGATVIRMGVQMSDPDMGSVLAGPCHPAFGHLVLSRILYRDITQKIHSLGWEPRSGHLQLRVHPSRESRLRGDRNRNLVRLKKQFPEIDFQILIDPDLEIDQVAIVKSPA